MVLLPLVLKKIKSPTCAFFIEIFSPCVAIAADVLGNEISKLLKVVNTKPEQSIPAFVVPPYLYFTPKFSEAKSTISAVNFFVFFVTSLEATTPDCVLQLLTKMLRRNRKANFFKALSFSKNKNYFAKEETINCAVFELAPFPPNFVSNAS